MASASDASSSSEDDAEEELDAASMALFMRVQKNSRDYDAHAGLLDALRDAGLPNALASARERFLEEFPLTEATWNAWIDDARSNARSDADAEHVEALYRRAQGDHVSPRLWLQHIDFIAGCASGRGGKADVRALLEEAATSVGAHVVDGAALWARYRSFERAQLDQAREQEGAGDAHAAAATAGQYDRLVQLYCRQVSLPLRDNDAAMSEARAWLAHEQPPPGSTFESAEAAMQALDLRHKEGAAALKVREPHEQAVAHASFALAKAVAALATTAAAVAAAAAASATVVDQASAESGIAAQDDDEANNNISTEQAQAKLEAQEAHARAAHGHGLAESRVDSTWLAYVDFELESESADRAVLLLERAVAAHPRRPALWLRGARLLRQRLHNRPAAHNWVARAVRNCWWSSKLWLEIMRSIELKATGDALGEVKSIADRALELGQATAEDYVQILLGVSMCARRQAARKLRGVSSDSAEELSHAHTAALGQIRDISQWASGFLSRSYPGWAAAGLQLARQHALAAQELLITTARSCCAAVGPALTEAVSGCRALWENVVKEYSTSLQPWLEYSRFERIVHLLGLPLQGGRDARCGEVLRRAVAHVSDFPQAASEAWLQYAQEAGSLHECEDAEQQYEAAAQIQQAKSQPRSHHKSDAKQQQSKHQRGTKRQRVTTRDGDSSQHEARSAKRLHNVKAKPAAQHTTAKAKARPGNWNLDATTVFVTSLPDCATEADLQCTFGTYGTIQKVCMMYDRRDCFKGNAFVQFESADASQKALKELGVEGGVEQRLRSSSDDDVLFTPAVVAARMSAAEAWQQQATAQAARKQKRQSKSKKQQQNGTAHKHADNRADVELKRPKPRKTTSLFSMRPRVIVHKKRSANK